MSNKIFEVDRVMSRGRLFVKAEHSEAFPGDVVRLRNQGVIMNATVETRTTDGFVARFGMVSG